MAPKRKARSDEDENPIEHYYQSLPASKSRKTKGETSASSRALHELSPKVYNSRLAIQQASCYGNKILDLEEPPTTSSNQLGVTAREPPRLNANVSTLEVQRTEEAHYGQSEANFIQHVIANPGRDTASTASSTTPTTESLIATHSRGVASDTGHSALDPQAIGAESQIRARVPGDLPAFGSHFADSGAADQWRAANVVRIPSIDPDEDPTLESVHAESLKWVELMYKMITNRENIGDNIKSDTYKKYERLARISSENTEAACHYVMREVFTVCHLGFLLGDPNMDMAKPRKGKKDGWSPTENPHEFEKIADDELQCFMRMIKICYALKHEKTICAEVLSGGFGDRLVRQFVNAPIEWRRRKGNNRHGNDGKAEKSVQRAEKRIEQKRAAEQAKKLAAASGQGATNVDTDVTSTKKNASDASKARASKKLEPPMNSIVKEAFALGITIPDLYVGLLIDEEEEEEEQHVPLQSPATASTQPLWWLGEAIEYSFVDNVGPSDTHQPEPTPEASNQQPAAPKKRARRSAVVSDPPKRRAKESKTPGQEPAAPDTLLEMPAQQALPSSTEKYTVPYSYQTQWQMGSPRSLQSAEVSFDHQLLPIAGYQNQLQPGPYDQFPPARNYQVQPPFSPAEPTEQQLLDAHGQAQVEECDP